MLKQVYEFITEKMPSGATAHAHVVTGTIYKEIPHRARQEEYLLGPNPARVVRHAKCPVFVVRD